MARNITPAHIVEGQASNGKLTSHKAAHLNSKESSVQPAVKQKEELDLLPLSPELEKMLEDSWADNEELYRALRNS